MARVICISNRKGGTGKTMTAVNLAYEFAKSGYKTLHIDLDPQANSSAKYFPDYESMTGISEVLSKQSDITEAVYMIEGTDNLYAVPSKIELDEVVEMLQIKSQVAILSKILKKIKYDFDVIVLDTNPSIPIMIKNCVYASDLIIVPACVDQNSIKGIDLTLKMINETIEDSPIDLNVNYRVLLTMVTYSGGEQTNIAKEVIGLIREMYQENALNTTIRLQSKPAQLQTFYNDYHTTDHNTSLGSDYRSLKQEIESLLRNE